MSTHVRLAGFASLLFCLMIAPSRGLGQAPSTTSSSDMSGYEIGLHGGAFMPQKIYGITEVMNVAGFRLATGNNVGKAELEAFFGHGDGAEYRSGSVGYRYNLGNDIIAVHTLVGLHADTYTPLGRSSSAAVGLDLGGGCSLPVTDQIGVRADFKYRINPGSSVYVGVGLWMLFPHTGSGS